MDPIWKDKYVTLGSAASYDFRIQAGGATIYQGRAQKRPGESNVTIRINDICADYLANTYPTLPGSANAFNAEASVAVAFTVQTLSGSTWTTVQTVTFVNDWSYDYGKTYGSGQIVQAAPACKRIDRRQPLTLSVVQGTTVSGTITNKNGSTTSVSFSGTQGTCVLKTSNYTNAKAVTLGGKSFEVVDTCARFALYYQNAYGGWDSILIEGNAMEVDTPTRHTREGDYDNADVKARGVFNYVNEIDKSYTLNTGILSDSEAANLHHMINSPQAYLYDLDTTSSLPVVIDAATAEYKTFKNNGRQLIQLTFAVRLAQTRIRK